MRDGKRKEAVAQVDKGVKHHRISHPAAGVCDDRGLPHATVVIDPSDPRETLHRDRELSVLAVENQIVTLVEVQCDLRQGVEAELPILYGGG